MLSDLASEQFHQLQRACRAGAAASACVLMYATGESGRVSETARERLSGDGGNLGWV
jgi:hypothetical protein